jgi:hypothetical protein
MDFYQVNLAVFISTNAYLLYRHYQRVKISAKPTLVNPSSLESAEKEAHVRAVRKFQTSFFLPYALAVAADWLQVSEQTFFQGERGKHS